MYTGGYDPYGKSPYGFIMITFSGDSTQIVEEAIITWDLETGESSLAVAD